MRYKVLLTDRAESDIDSALLWFREQRASDAGKRWFNFLTERIQTLELHPDRCPVAAESEYAGAEIRELSFGRRQVQYRILFVIDNKVVTILRVWHASRDSMTREDLF